MGSPSQENKADHKLGSHCLVVEPIGTNLNPKP